jgi:hypothetical protein
VSFSGAQETTVPEKYWSAICTAAGGSWFCWAGWFCAKAKDAMIKQAALARKRSTSLS